MLLLYLEVALPSGVEHANTQHRTGCENPADVAEERVHWRGPLQTSCTWTCTKQGEARCCSAAKHHLLHVLRKQRSIAMTPAKMRT